MGLLPDHVLRRLYPEAETIGPASVDLHLGDTLLWWPEWIRRDPRIDQAHLWREQPILGRDEFEDGPVWMIQPGIRYLAATRERVEIRPDCAGQIAARSSWGRDGLAVICGPAGFLDPGFAGVVTLELSVIGSDLLIWPGASVAQLVVHRLTAVCEKPYGGRYQDQTEPTPSRMPLEVAR